MKLSEKLEKLIDSVNDIKVTQAKHGVILEENTKDLAEHMRRTELAETRLDLLEKNVEQINTKASTIWLVLTVIGSLIASVTSILATLKII